MSARGVVGDPLNGTTEGEHGGVGSFASNNASRAATGDGLSGANSNDNKRKIQDLVSAYVSKKASANMSAARYE